MKRFFFLLAACVAVLSCSTARQASRGPVPGTPWIGCTTDEIIEVMGDPDRIEGDGKDGSILVYSSGPDYSDPDYDILDPEASVKARKYANFYLDREGFCYKVDTNRKLPAVTKADDRYDHLVSTLLDILMVLPFFLTFEIFL